MQSTAPANAYIPSRFTGTVGEEFDIVRGREARKSSPLYVSSYLYTESLTLDDQ